MARSDGLLARMLSVLLLGLWVASEAPAPSPADGLAPQVHEVGSAPPAATASAPVPLADAVGETVAAGPADRLENLSGSLEEVLVFADQSLAATAFAFDPAVLSAWLEMFVPTARPLPPRAPPAAGDEAGALLVQGLGAPSTEAQPGTVLTAMFRVTNASRLDRVVTGTLDLAPGWQSVLPVRPFTVAGGGHGLHLVSVQIPSDAAPGTYEVGFGASGERAEPGRGSITVTVPQVRTMVLEAEAPAPPRAPAGTPYTVRLVVVNTGNVPAAIELRAASNLGMSLALDSARVRLRPGELRRVAVRVVPRDVPRQIRHVVWVEAQMEGAPVAQLASVTSVMPAPGAPPEHERGQAFQGEIAARGVQSGGATGGQIDASGALPLLGGILDGAVTLGDSRRGSLYQDRSRVGLRYAADGLALVAGDHVFALSPLTETGRYGFGAGADVEVGPVAAGAFVHRPRFGLGGTVFGGGFAGVQVHPDARVRANVAHQGGARGGTAVTLQGTVARSGKTALDAECGLGTSTVAAGAASGSARACSAQLVVDRPWLSYRGSVAAAEPGFPGRLRDVRAVSSSAAVRLSRGLRVEAALQDHRRGETLGGVETGSYRVGASLARQLGGRPVQVTVARTGQRFDGTASGLFDRQEASTQLATSYALGTVRLRGRAEVGQTRADDDPSPFQRYQAHARWAPPSGQSVHVAVEHRRGETLYRPTGETGWRADLGATLALAARTRLSLSASASLDRLGVGPTGVMRRYGFVQGHLQHVLASGHRIEMRGRTLATGGAFDARLAEYSVSYVVPLRVPLARRGSGSTVTGRVYDAETGAGLADVAVTLGLATVLTDADGVFVLSRPSEGTDYLRLDPVSAGIERVPLREMPLAVPAEGAVDLDIPMLRGARLTGQFRVAADSTAVALAGAVRGAVVELESAGRRLRAVTDRQGGFAFDGVPPGAWTLRVLHADLPRHHAVERDAYAVSLSPGGRSHLEIGVLPQRRQIRLLESGTVLRGVASASARPAPER